MKIRPAKYCKNGPKLLQQAGIVGIFAFPKAPGFKRALLAA
jgi:hypothetical protein